MSDVRTRAAATRRSPGTTRPASPLHVPLWVPIASLTLAVVGLGVSIYMTYEHFTQNKSLACSANGVINCAAVTTSPESMIFGVIPVAILGLVFFVGIIPILLPIAWRSPSKLIRRARLVGSGVGVGFVIYLIYAELFQIDKICEWCTGVHVITIALFGVIIFGTAAIGPADED